MWRDGSALGSHALKGAGKTKAWRCKGKPGRVHDLRVNMAEASGGREEMDGCRGPGAAPAGLHLPGQIILNPQSSASYWRNHFRQIKFIWGSTGRVGRLKFVSVCAINIACTIFKLSKGQHKVLRMERTNKPCQTVLQHSLYSHSTWGWMYSQGIFPSYLTCKQRCCLVGERANKGYAKLQWLSFFLFKIKLKISLAIWNFPGLGLNPCLNSDNAGSLTCRATRELLNLISLFELSNSAFLFLLFFSFFVLWGPHPQHMEVPRLGV